MTKGLHKNSIRKVDNPHQWMIDDARMELIQQIRAEIERQRKKIRPTNTGEMKVVDTPTQLEQGWLNALSWMEKVLDTLKEQPVCEGLKDETVCQCSMEYVKDMAFSQEREVIRAAFENGWDACKEQMMKEEGKHV